MKRTAKEYLSRGLAKLPLPERVYRQAEFRLWGSPYPDSTEPELSAAVFRTVEDGDVFWDVGAMNARYARVVSTACHPAGLVAFEPNPQFYEKCASRVRDLLGEFPRRTFQMALGDASERVDFATEMPEEAYSSSGAVVDDRQLPEYDRVESVSVPMETGDSMIRQYPEFEPTVVKIDVEGAEHEVLKGLETALSRGSIRAVFCEIHLPNDGISPSIDDFGASEGEIYATLREHGYEVELVTQRSERDKHIKASR